VDLKYSREFPIRDRWHFVAPFGETADESASNFCRMPEIDTTNARRLASPAGSPSSCPEDGATDLHHPKRPNKPT
jgi:hypothetical protein